MECDISPYLEDFLYNEANENKNDEIDFSDFQFYDEDFLQPLVNSFLMSTNSLEKESKSQQDNIKCMEDVDLNSFLESSILTTDENGSDNMDCFVSVLGVDLVFAYNSNSEAINSSYNYINLEKSDSATDLWSCKDFSTIFENDLQNSQEIDMPPTIENASFNGSPCIIEEKNIRRRSLIYERPSSQSMEKHHPNDDDSKPNRKYTYPHKAIEDSKYFMCSVVNCNKVYSKASHLKAHLKRHLGEKPFVCNWEKCTWKFSRSDELARHRRSHLGIKPYKCSFCDKAFSRSDHLTKHYKVHKKKVGFDVHVCSK